MIASLRTGAALMWLVMAVSSAAETERPVVVLETSMGDLAIELFQAEAPQTVANFLALVDAGHYAGLIFHRVIADFVIQAGGHSADMAYREAPRTVPNESSNGLRNERSTVAMARLEDPDSAGAQFFINLRDNDSLDHRRWKPGYTVFGRVTEGMPVVDAIAAVDTTMRGGMHDVPIEPVVIRKARRQ